MDDSNRSELKQMYNETTGKMPEAMRRCLPDNAFDLYASDNWANVAERLMMNRKKKGFVPMIDVETGTSDASIVEKRRRSLLVMNDENNKELEAHLQQLWIASISNLDPEFQALCSKEPPEKIMQRIITTPCRNFLERKSRRSNRRQSYRR